MGKTKVIELSAEQRAVLEHGYRRGKSHAFRVRCQMILLKSEWMKKDLYVFFLPRYSPHLNKAETYRRKARYEWLKPTDYRSFSKFRKKIYHIFAQVGVEYKIAFKEPDPST